MISADVPHLFLKEPSLPAMSVPYWVDLDMCLSADSVAVWGFLHVDYWDVSEATG